MNNVNRVIINIFCFFIIGSIALLISIFIYESSTINCTKIIGTVNSVTDKFILVSYNVSNE